MIYIKPSPINHVLLFIAAEAFLLQIIKGFPEPTVTVYKSGAVGPYGKILPKEIYIIYKIINSDTIEYLYKEKNAPFGHDWKTEFIGCSAFEKEEAEVLAKIVEGQILMYDHVTFIKNQK